MDVISQGNTPLEAVSMVFEATAIVASDDLMKGRNPLDRRAPAEDWEALDRLQEKCESVTNLEEFLSRLSIAENQHLALVVQFKVQVDLRTHQPAESRRISRMPALACQQVAC